MRSRYRKLDRLAVATTCAPFDFQHRAGKETPPPPAPWIRRVLWGEALVVSISICQAVRAGIGMEAETTKLSERGFRTRSLRGTTAYSAKLPQVSPKTESPFRKEVREPGAISSMTPAKSWPRVGGSLSAPFGL